MNPNLKVEKITITCPRDYTNLNKVAVIKALRMLSGMGLKEAKDASEVFGEQILTLSTHYLHATDPVRVELEIEEQLRILRSNGVQVGAPVYIILQSLRDLATQALRQNEDELANEILQLVLAEKLRRAQF